MSVNEALKSVMRKLKEFEQVACSDVEKTSRINKVELRRVEREINFEYPSELKYTYTCEFASVLFKWNVDNMFFGPECKRGYLRMYSPTESQKISRDWMNLLEDPRAYTDKEILDTISEDWPNWIPIFGFPNGDAFCIDKRNEKIVFFEHEVIDTGVNLHGMTISESFSNLIEVWGGLAFVDVYDWYDACNENGIDRDSSIFAKLNEQL